MTLRKLSDNEKQEIKDLDFSHEDMYKMLKAQPDVEIKTITIETLYKGDDLLAVTPQFDDISNLEAVSILLNVLVADARQCTDVEDFIKTIISMWGTYDETENN